MTRYRLTYFDFPGSRGEECRLALFVNGVDFEDRRIKRDEWKELKPTTPYGSLPTLEREGAPTLAQVNAILTYVGRKYGHHPKDAWDAARHEAVFSAVEELRGAIAPTGDVDDEATKKQRREAFADGYLSRWCANVQEQVRGPFLDGEKLHLADIKLYMICDSLMKGAYDYIGAAAFESFPKLRALHESVASHPDIRAWRER